jgi:CubicO group peptidase (beta-lactamase class C family)
MKRRREGPDCPEKEMRGLAKRAAVPTFIALSAGMALAHPLIAHAAADPSKAGAAAAGFPAELDDYVAQALRDWDVPGAALAVVKDAEVVAVRGYGVRELGKPARVDAETIFDTASLTKAFTAAAIATLVDEGKLSWDEPVHHYLPALEFSDSYLTENLTLRDLLAHRTGIKNNSAWYFGNLSQDELIAAFKHLQPQTPFRARWNYSNIGYQAAAEVASSVSGVSWEDLVTRRILQPLGMKCTIANFDDVPKRKNYASPHDVIDGVQLAVPREIARMSTPAAGGVQACAADLATWMLFQLGDGTWNGKRIISAEAMHEMQSAQINVPTTAAFRAARQVRHTVAYGFGWQVWDYRGHWFLWHTGSGDGQSACVALLPDEKIGVAFVINSWKQGGSAFNVHLVSRFLDYYLGEPTKNYLGEYKESWLKNTQRDADERRAVLEARPKVPRAALPLSAYAGRYRDRLGIGVSVVEEGGALFLRYGHGQRGRLEHWNGDVFRVRWENPLADAQRMTFISFAPDEAGKVNKLHMRVFGEDIDAERMADGASG